MNIQPSLIIDIVIILIFVGFVSYGLQKGFMRAAYQIISLGLTLFIVFAFRSTATDCLYNSQIGQKIVVTINQKVDDAISQTDYTNDISDTISELGLPEFVTNGVTQTAKSAEQSREKFVKSTADSITDSIMVSLASTILFIISKIGVSAIMSALIKIFRLPVLKQVNKLIGGIIGVINALLVIYIISALVMVFSPTYTKTTINDTINQTYIGKHFYNNNLLMRLFNNKIGLHDEVDITQLDKIR